MNEEVLAYFITWTCYGTFLPGDQRGWTKWHQGEKSPQPLLEQWCRDQMLEPVCFLDTSQRRIVNTSVQDHCNIRGWTLHAVNCRSNHCHVVVTALDYDGDLVRDQFKAWCKRRLREDQKKRRLDHELREHWWSRKGSVRKLFDEKSVDAAAIYTLEAQEVGGSKMEGS